MSFSGEKLTDWLMNHYGQEQFNPGLDRMRTALAPILPQLKKSKVITIAGTNGKGETTLRLSQYLAEHPHLVWTSPHIERLTERFRSEKGEISEAELERLIQYCHQDVKKRGLKLSYYEFLFLVFCQWASENNPEFLLLEVGLGGRLDAVNVFDAELVLLPSISRDHQEFLGHRYEMILKEKLAVLRSEKAIIHFLHSQYLKEKTSEYCKSIGANCLSLSEVSKLHDYQFSERNQLLALAAHQYLKGTPLPKIKESLHSKNFPKALPLEHRGESLIKGAEWLLYGSHNVDGMRKLIQFLRSDIYNFSERSFDSVLIAFSKRDTADLKVMMKMMKEGKLGPVMVTCFDHPKAAPVDVIKRLCVSEGLNFVEDIESFVQGKNSGQVLVTGSYYFLGHIKSILRS